MGIAVSTPPVFRQECAPTTGSVLMVGAVHLVEILLGQESVKKKADDLKWRNLHGWHFGQRESPDWWHLEHGCPHGSDSSGTGECEGEGRWFWLTESSRVQGLTEIPRSGEAIEGLGFAGQEGIGVRDRARTTTEVGSVLITGSGTKSTTALVSLSASPKTSVQFGSGSGEKINPWPNTDQSPNTGTHGAGWLLIYHGIGIGCRGQQREPDC